MQESRCGDRCLETHEHISMKTSPHKTESIASAIDAVEMVPVQGMDLGLVIRGADIRNPVLLHLHGGPGQSEFGAYLKKRRGRLEQIFTICYLEQRGSGKSYSPDIPPETMTLDQFVEDAHEVTQYLKKKFGQPKVFVLGHSWGTMLGSFLIHRHPGDYHAYLGIGQMADQLASEKISLDFLQAQARSRNDTEALAILAELKVPRPDSPMVDWIHYLMTERTLVIKYRGIFLFDDVGELKESVLASEDYTDQEKENYLQARCADFSITHLWPTMIGVNFSVDLKRQQVPVFIFQGIHDYATAFAPARHYFDVLEAPLKRFYTFENSAHSPHTEEYEKFEALVVRDILPLASAAKSSALSP